MTSTTASGTVTVLENGTLLDVKFQVAERAGGRLRVRNPAGIEAEMPDRLAYGPAMFVGPIQERRVERAGERAAAEKWRAEAHAFLLRKPDHLDGEYEPPGAKQLDECDCQYSAEDAVECSAVRNGIEMRADVKTRHSGRWRLRRSRGIHAAKIPGGVDAN